MAGKKNVLSQLPSSDCRIYGQRRDDKNNLRELWIYHGSEDNGTQT